MTTRGSPSMSTSAALAVAAALAGCRTDGGAGVRDAAVDESAFVRLVYLEGARVCSARCQREAYAGVKAQIVTAALTHAEGAAKLRGFCTPEGSVALGALPAAASPAFRKAVTGLKLASVAKGNAAYKALMGAMVGPPCGDPVADDIAIVGADDAVTTVDGGFAPPANAVAHGAALGPCDGAWTCPAFVNATDLGCAATGPDGKVFKSLEGGNNTCDLIGVQTQICAVDPGPAGFTATCYTKGSASGASAANPLAAPPGATSKPLALEACGGAVLCAQFIDDTDLGCVGKGPAGEIFKALTPGNNGCAGVGLRAQVCGAGLKADQIQAVCFQKSASADPLVPPAGAAAKPVKVSPCGGGELCAQSINAFDLGCAAVGPAGQIFKAVSAGNNGCALVALRAQICGAGLKADQVKAVCFAKQMAADANDPLAPPAGAAASPAVLPACGGAMVCPQVVKATDRGCAAKGPAGRVFTSLNGGNNVCDLIGVRARICAAGLKTADFTAACFKAP